MEDATTGRPRLAILVLGTLLLAVGCGPGADEGAPGEQEGAEATPSAESEQMAEADPDERAAVEALVEEWVTHYNLHDPDMVADLYTEDAWLLNPNLAVAEGRDEVEAAHAAAMEAGPTAQVELADVRFFGDQAVGIGTYSVTLDEPPEWMPEAYSGSYLTLLRRIDDEWRIEGRLTNYDAAVPEDFQWADSGEAPPEGQAMAEVLEEYETHWNLQHPDMVADFYSEDAWVAFPDGPPLEGRDAVAASIAESMEAQPSSIDVHEVETIDLGEGWALNGGWYEIFPEEGDERTQWGMYLSLMERGEDGDWAFRWQVVNGRPEGDPQGEM